MLLRYAMLLYTQARVQSVYGQLILTTLLWTLGPTGKEEGTDKGGGVLYVRWGKKWIAK